MNPQVLTQYKLYQEPTPRTMIQVETPGEINFDNQHGFRNVNEF